MRREESLKFSEGEPNELLLCSDDIYFLNAQKIFLEENFVIFYTNVKFA